MLPRDVPRARIPADSPVDGEFRIRLPYLFTDRDEWWEVIPRLTVEQILERQQLQIDTGQIIETPIEVGLERIEPLVTDAVEKIVQYGIPWLIEARNRECGAL